MGHTFMKNYYVVYDASPLDKGQDYIQIGLGEPVDNITTIMPNTIKNRYDNNQNEISRKSK